MININHLVSIYFFTLHFIKEFIDRLFDLLYGQLQARVYCLYIPLILVDYKQEFFFSVVKIVENSIG